MVPVGVTSTRLPLRGCARGERTDDVLRPYEKPLLGSARCIADAKALAASGERHVWASDLRKPAPTSQNASHHRSTGSHWPREQYDPPRAASSRRHPRKFESPAGAGQSSDFSYKFGRESYWRDPRRAAAFGALIVTAQPCCVRERPRRWWFISPGRDRGMASAWRKPARSVPQRALSRTSTAAVRESCCLNVRGRWGGVPDVARMVTTRPRCR